MFFVSLNFHDPKFLDRHNLANSIDPAQTAILFGQTEWTQITLLLNRV